jgi:ArsR family transcriptional regulator, arsenate/arsenite/antimonite-responsive transcriptional repressor
VRIQEDVATETARIFKGLSDKTRVQIFEFLRRRCGEVAVDENGDVRPIQGPTFGEVCCHITGKEKVNSTISFHLNELRESGLITVEKRGRLMICGLNLPVVARLASYLSDSLPSAEVGDPGCDLEEGCC